MKRILLFTFILFIGFSLHAQTIIFQPVLSGDVTSGTDPFTDKALGSAPADTQIVVNATHGFVMIHNGHNIGLVKKDLTRLDGSSGIKVEFTFTMDSSKNSNGKAFNIELGDGFSNSGSPNTANDFAQFNISSGTNANAQSMNISGSSIDFQSTPVNVIWYLNNTENAISYTAPDNNKITLASNTWDLWIGNTLALSAQAGNMSHPINSFKITANSSGVQTGEFDNLKISTFSSTTPITFKPLTAKMVNNTVQLDWATGTENNSSVFQVLRSTDGKMFAQIGENIKAAGNSTSMKSYKAFDYSPEVGINYYKIKEIDLDGKFMTSNTVTIKVESKNLKTWPSPATEQITIDGAIGNIYIYSASGKLIKSVVATQGKTVVDVRALSAGIYFIKSENATGSFIKQ